MSDFLPKKPTDVELKVMYEMFQASVDGEAYDVDKFGQYFRPAGMSQQTGDPNTTMSTPAAPAPATDTTVTETPAPAATTETPAPQETASEGGDDKSRAHDILAMIRNRQK